MKERQMQTTKITNKYVLLQEILYIEEDFIQILNRRVRMNKVEYKNTGQ